MLSKEQINDFSNNGFIILKNFLRNEYLEKLKETLMVMFSHNLKENIHNKKIDDVVNQLEGLDHSKVYNVQKAICSSTEALSLVNSLNLGELYSDLYNIDKKKVHLQLLQTPVQFPNDDRFDFEWHQESGSYNSFSKILTCWFPILGSVNEIDGSMTLIPGSHKNGKREFTFVKKESGLNDWRVQLKNGEEKEAVLAKIDPTDVILFDSDIIHKSVANVGKRIRVTGIVRALDICSNSKILPIQEMKNLNAKEYTE